MNRLIWCVLLGCFGGSVGSFIACLVVGQMYAEDLSVLVPTQVNQAALKTADWMQGYDYEPIPTADKTRSN